MHICQIGKYLISLIPDEANLGRPKRANSAQTAKNIKKATRRFKRKSKEAYSTSSSASSSGSSKKSVRRKKKQKVGMEEMKRKLSEGAPKVNPKIKPPMATIDEQQEIEVAKLLEEDSPTTPATSHDEEQEDFVEQNFEYGVRITRLQEGDLKKYIRQLMPKLKKIWDKKSKDSWRLKHFLSGFKARREMVTTTVLRHPFTNEQEDLVREQIISRFKLSYQDQRVKHGFLMDVMVPETLVLIYQLHFQIKTIKEAEKRMVNTPLRKIFKFGAAGVKGRLIPMDEDGDVKTRKTDEFSKTPSSVSSDAANSSSTSLSHSSTIDRLIRERDGNASEPGEVFYGEGGGSSNSTQSQSSRLASPTRPSKLRPPEAKVQEGATGFDMGNFSSSSSVNGGGLPRRRKNERKARLPLSSSSSSKSSKHGKGTSWRQRTQKSFLHEERDERDIPSPDPQAPPTLAPAHSSDDYSPQSGETGKPTVSLKDGYRCMCQLERDSRSMPLEIRKRYVAENLLQFTNSHKLHRLPKYILPKYSRKKGMRIDREALEAINHDTGGYTTLSARSVPICSLGNGSCFYNSVSIALFGHDGYAGHIKFMTAMYLLRKNDKYKKNPRNFWIELVSGENDNEVFLEACRKNEPSSPRHIQACADALKIRIILQTPRIGSVGAIGAMSGHELEGWNNVFEPLNVTTEQEREALPSIQIIFYYSAGIVEVYRPNHFVPVLSYEEEREQSPVAGKSKSHKAFSGTETESTKDSDLTSDESPPPDVVAKGKQGPKVVIPVPEVFRKLQLEEVDGEEIPQGRKKQIYCIVQTAAGKEADALVDDVGRYRRPTTTTYDYIREGEGDKLTPIQSFEKDSIPCNLRTWYYGFRQSGTKQKKLTKVGPSPVEENYLQMRRQYKYGPDKKYRRTVTWITKIRKEDEHLKSLRLVQYTGAEVGGSKTTRPHGNAIRVSD